MGKTGPIEFDVYYKESRSVRPITYEIAIDADKSGRPYVLRERLRQRRSGQKRGWPFSFLMLNSGKGVAWRGEQEGYEIDESQAWTDFEKLIKFLTPEESSETEYIELEERRRLGIATLGALAQHPRISAFRRFIEGWYLSYFTPDAARSLPLAGPQQHLNIHGDNLGNVVQFMERQHPRRFNSILDRIAAKIPGIDRIDTEKTSDGRLLLRFNDKGFEDPFYAQQMSDGTLKVFAYLLLLEDPTPPPFLCIEEPEMVSITSCWRRWPTNSASTPGGQRAARRFSSRRINPTSSTRLTHRRSGYWKKARTVSRLSAGPAKSRL